MRSDFRAEDMHLEMSKRLARDDDGDRDADAVNELEHDGFDVGRVAGNADSTLYGPATKANAAGDEERCGKRHESDIRDRGECEGHQRCASDALAIDFIRSNTESASEGASPGRPAFRSFLQPNGEIACGCLCREGVQTRAASAHRQRPLQKPRRR